MANRESKPLKRYVLLWGEAAAIGESLTPSLASYHYELLICATLSEAMDLLANEALTEGLEAVLLPATKSTSQRLEFLKEFERRAPRLFLKVPVLLLGDAAGGGPVVVAKQRSKEERSNFLRARTLSG